VFFQRHGRCCGRASVSHVTEDWYNFRQAKIENLGVSAFGHKDIRRLNITMDDSSGMCGIESVRELDSQRHHGLDLHRLCVLASVHPETP